jgi:alkanesulfonate monooxygenase SsuD/methylene tetrahydromethanopterin reductase-like flavin-dependent oxidoreductase (luciferase family)
MEFGIFNLMGARDPATPTGQIFGEVAEQTKRADELGYTIAWFAEHHFSNYCMCASPLMMVAHCAANTRNIRLGTAVVVVPLFSYDGKHYKMPSTHIAARPVQKPLPIYVAGHTQAMFRAAARHGYRVLSSGRLGGEKLLAGQYADLPRKMCLWSGRT